MSGFPKLAGVLLAGLLLASVIPMLKPPAARAAPEEPNVEWSETYGGSALDLACSVIQTSDGGFAIAGYTCSYGAGNSDFWLVKLSGKGPVQKSEKPNVTRGYWLFAGVIVAATIGIALVLRKQKRGKFR